MQKTENAAFVHMPPIVEINSGVAIIHYESLADRAMSVRNLQRAVDRCERALKRHAAGEQNIIVDD